MSSRDFITPKSHREWFLYYLYNDKDFLGYKQKFSDTIKKEFGEDYYTVILLLISSEPIISQLKKKSNSQHLVDMINQAAKRFDVSTATVESGFAHHNQVPGPSRMPLPIVKEGELFIKINANTRLKDIEKIWFLVAEEQKKLPGFSTKSQSNIRPDLIYAIYKIRLPNEYNKRLSFEKIFKLYQEGKLPGYDGSTNQYTSSDSLERIYNRYKPKPDTI